MKKHSYLGWTKSSVAIAALMLPAIAFAQADQPAEEEQFSGDIVVTATRQSESLSKVPLRALLQTWGTAARRHPVGGLGSIGEMLIEHNHGFGQGRGSNSECSFNQAHLPHDTWLQAPCLGLSFA